MGRKQESRTRTRLMPWRQMTCNSLYKERIHNEHVSTHYVHEYTLSSGKSVHVNVAGGAMKTVDAKM